MKNILFIATIFLLCSCTSSIVPKQTNCFMEHFLVQYKTGEGYVDSLISRKELPNVNINIVQNNIYFKLGRIDSLTLVDMPILRVYFKDNFGDSNSRDFKLKGKNNSDLYVSIDKYDKDGIITESNPQYFIPEDSCFTTAYNLDGINKLDSSKVILVFFPANDKTMTSDFFHQYFLTVKLDCNELMH